MEVWITRYALTKGIIKKEAHTTHSKSMICVNGKFPEYFHSNDWHETKEAAIVKAEDMKDKKIASLKKQLKKMENLTF